MAELKNRKKKKPGWPWVLLLLIVIGIFWYLDETGNGTDKRSEYDDPTELPADDSYIFDSDALTPFIKFVIDSLHLINEETDKILIARGFNYMADDLAVIIEKGSIYDMPIIARYDTLRVRQQQITKERIEEDFSEILKRTAFAAVDLIINIQIKKFSALKEEIISLRLHADEIRKHKTFSSQKEVLKKFFFRAAVIIDKMNRTPLT